MVMGNEYNLNLVQFFTIISSLHQSYLLKTIEYFHSETNLSVNLNKDISNY